MKTEINLNYILCKTPICQNCVSRTAPKMYSMLTKSVLSLPDDFQIEDLFDEILKHRMSLVKLTENMLSPRAWASI